MSEVGPGIGVLDDGPRAPRGRGDFEGFFSPLVSMAFLSIFKTEMYSTRA